MYAFAAGTSAQPTRSSTVAVRVHRKCTACEDESRIQRAANGPTPNAAPAWSTISRARVGGGAPLPSGTRGFMEARFARDFSHVRVHTGAAAAQSAAALSARAYTVGRDVIFGAGEYAPGTDAGRRLIAHELQHVVQQATFGASAQPSAALDVSAPEDADEREADAAADAVMRAAAPPRPNTAPAGLQRTCNAALGPPKTACSSGVGLGAGGDAFQFVVGCDDLRTGEDVKLGALSIRLVPGTKIRIHGYASDEGPAAFNLDLSCHRANKIADHFRSTRPDCPIDAVLQHGATKDPGWTRADARTVIVEQVKPEKPPEYVCGPDATDWLVDQINKAKTNAKVLDIKSDLDDARKSAPSIGSGGLDASSIAEGGVLWKMLEAWDAAGKKPPQTPEAKSQIAAAGRGQTQLVAAILAASQKDLDAISTLWRIRSAGNHWKALVGHKKPYDFKWVGMSKPNTEHCPQKCDDSITLCGGSFGSNCYRTDLPGNVFYAAIGHFVGFSELALQLGSQMAQLSPPAGVKPDWDPPEDTRYINFGYWLADPLTRAGFCTDLKAHRAYVTQPVCKECSDKVYPALLDP